MDTENSSLNPKQEKSRRSGAPRSKIPQLRREQILEAALQVFSAKGADGATNQDIAKAAGLASPGLIYHYFKDRNDLLKQVIVRYHPLSVMLADETADEEDDLRGALTKLAEAAQKFKDNQELSRCFKIILCEILKNGDGQDLFAALPQKIFAYLQRAFDRAKREKLIADLPTEALICNFAGALMFPVFLKVIFNKNLDADPQRQVDLFMKGILPPPPSQDR